MPYVVAPPKVLNYLRLIFDNPGLYYMEVHMDDATAMNRALQRLNETEQCLLRWMNVRVDHSCLSYGFVLVLADRVDILPPIDDLSKLKHFVHVRDTGFGMQGHTILPPI